MSRMLEEIRGAYAGPRPAVSVVILTLNEAVNIRGAIESCVWSDDVNVLDSCSTDRTVEIANEAGAKVFVNPFRSFGAQRNWAIDNIPLKHDWVFHLDADERFTPELVREIAEVLDRAPNEAGFYVANQMILDGAWIRRASGYPAYQMRLFHKGRMRFNDHGHGQREETNGAIGTLKHPYVHYNFSKGLDEWRARHDRYSTLEAKEILAARAGGEGVSWSGLFSAKKIVRRRALKGLAARIPMRPQVRWLHTVILKGALLDGRAGLKYAGLLYWYEREIARKAARARD
ncbi:MAG: glycosyltransferase family 2 protein [Phycisphaeraceae bacterium]|nr:glycosyltransferase family 2 protein [Phycisphaeraceae bacterium]